MNLIQHTNRNFILSTIIALPIVCLGLFFSIKFFIVEEIDEKLYVDQLRTIESIKSSEELPNLVPVVEVEIASKKEVVPTQLKEVYVYDPIEKEDELFRELSSVNEVNGEYYIIKVRSSMLETHDFIFAVIVVVVLLMITLILITFLMNRRLSKKMWEPFHQNLVALRNYSVVDQKDICLAESSIEEFSNLNHTILELTTQINADYKSLKEFTENASHEIQTPLAIIMNSVEQMMQDEKNTETEGLYKIYQSAKKLSNLNKKLLLLTKIENRQFNSILKVDINTLVHDKINVFEELNSHLKLNIEFVSDDPVVFQMDKELADLLVSNLISNAFKHNISDGVIHLKLGRGQFIIENSAEGYVDPEKLFDRFVHGGNKNSLGIGLAIVQTIARISGLKIDLKTEKNFFSITLSEIQN